MEQAMTRRSSSGSKVRSNYAKSTHHPSDYYGHNAPAPTSVTQKARSKQNLMIANQWSPEPESGRHMGHSLGSAYKPVPKVITPRTKNRSENFTEIFLLKILRKL